ncbi:MAG: hypothetical protein LUD72_07470 [Bacteroidales bacterium]|nr:hypothetical protein [Bacteroidales bacterium]
MFSNAFDRQEILDNLDSLADRYNQESEKPDGERNDGLLRQLYFARLYQAMKLSTWGIRI